MRSVSAEPQRKQYDVVIVGGAVIGSSAAFFLSANPTFDGTVLVVERDHSYATASTTLTNSCMRQQFSTPINVRISQFGAHFVRNFREYLGGDPEVPDLFFHEFGYLYLARDGQSAAQLRRNQAMQAGLGAGTRLLSRAEIAAEYPFFHLDDIVLGSHNPVDEGYFDSGTMFDWLRRAARRNGVEYVAAEVVGLERDGSRITGVTLASGVTVGCGTVVNAAGPRAGVIARMAGTSLPVEPRKRYTFVFRAAEPLDRDLPLTIDPNGIHVRTDGAAYMAGCTPDPDPAVDPTDFAMDHDIFEDVVWPALAHRIPAFERIKVTSQWAGHYAYNRLDQNAIVGPHDEVVNLIFANGFSGHGMQQSPAIGRGVAELVVDGGYRSLDLSPLGYRRVRDWAPRRESAVI